LTYQNNVKSILEDAFKNNTKVITEEIAKNILTAYDIKVPRFALVQDVESAIKEANSIGYPLVAKIVSPQILIKRMLGVLKSTLKMKRMLKLHLMICMYAFQKNMM
jgi:acyl-CoA synthetase (NDP forming)